MCVCGVRVCVYGMLSGAKCHVVKVKSLPVLHHSVFYTFPSLGITHCRLNEFSHTIYWKILISILGMSGHVIKTFLEKNG